jgi:AraC family transcriptional regulator
MEPTISQKPGFKVVGKAIQVSMKNGENATKIPAFWAENYHDGTLEALLEAALDDGVLNGAIVGVCYDYNPATGEFTYMGAAENGDEPIPEGWVEKDVPAATWAVYESIGPMPGAIQQVWQSIMADFTSPTQYAHAEGPDLEVYFPGDMSAADYRCEVWVPVVAKW